MLLGRKSQRVLFSREGSCPVRLSNCKWIWENWCFLTLLLIWRYKFFVISSFVVIETSLRYLDLMLCADWQNKFISRTFHIPSEKKSFLSISVYCFCRRRNGIILKIIWMLLGLWVLHIFSCSPKLKLHRICELRELLRDQLSPLRYKSIRLRWTLLNRNCGQDVQKTFSRIPLW